MTTHLTSPVELSFSRRRLRRSAADSPIPPTQANLVIQHRNSSSVGPSPSSILAPWDRTVDVVYHRRRHDYRNPWANKIIPELTLTRFMSDQGRTPIASGLFRLPPHIRQHIFDLVTQNTQGTNLPVRLNPFCFSRDCWQPQHFTSFADAFASFQPYRGVCATFNAELMLMFITRHTFHVVVSPFTRSGLNPLATTWLDRYGSYIRRIVVEVDLTRLGLGPSPLSKDLLPALQQVEALLFAFAQSQARRHHQMPLESLILLCRRFYGSRGQHSPENPSMSIAKTHNAAGNPSNIPTWQSPHSDISENTSSPNLRQTESPYPSAGQRVTSPNTSADTSRLAQDCVSSHFSTETTPGTSAKEATTSRKRSVSISTASKSTVSSIDSAICPEQCLSVCDHLQSLRGHIDAIRMCGFSESYTHRLIAAIFLEALSTPAREHSYRIAPSAIWPRLPGQSSWVDGGYGHLVLDDHSDTNGPATVPYGPIQFPPPTTWSSGSASHVGSEYLALRRRTMSSGPSLLNKVVTTRSQASSEAASLDSSLTDSVEDRFTMRKFIHKCSKSRERKVLRKRSSAMLRA